MRILLARLVAAGVLSLAVGGMAVAQTDPTVHQIYEAAASGHLDQAQQMIDQVLRDHPDSAKAHYVQSELYAREGKFGLARAELDRAEQLAPGLPKEDPRSVAALKSELARAGRAAPPFGVAQAPVHHFPWGVVLILALGAGVFWMLLSRRRTSAPYPSSAMPTAAAGPYGPGYGPGGPGAPLGGGGIGSAVAGGLAGGLAAGAGVVAGEEIARRLLGGEHPSAPPDPVADGSELTAGNRDMGGSDFGVNDPGTWDDNSGGGSWSDNSGGGGGDDWT